MTDWPALEQNDATRETVHRWSQIIGKIRMKLTPLVNHWWNVPLYVTPRGMTTSLIPYGDRSFAMELDFIDHLLHVRMNDGRTSNIKLFARSVADFYAELFSTLRALGIEVKIWTTPVEIENPVPLDRDEEHHSYDRDWVERLRRTLELSSIVFQKFRGEFIGKCSPVHFFWGSFDLAVTRFSGRPAPQRADADSITREAYSHEVSSVGFWPGAAGRLPHATFYSYAAPEPEGFRTARIEPPSAYYNEPLGGFYLHLDELRREANPDETLLAFCRTTYDAAATHAKWDATLDRRS